MKRKFEQPRKDSDAKRVNFDNERESKFNRDYERRPHNKESRKDKSRKPKAESRRGNNDVKWYTRNPQMVESSAGSLIFSNTTGQAVASLKDQYSIPGIMRLTWIPAFGNTNVKAIKQAQESIYSYVVHANSRNQSYDPADLMLMIVGVAHLFTWISNGIRAFGLMKRFEGGANIYTPKYLVESCGFNYEDLKMHQGDLWFYLNQLIAQTGQLWVPKNLPFIERWFWLSANVYMDSESTKGQFYMFTPRTAYKFVNVNTGSALDTMGPIDGNSLDFNGPTKLKFAQYVQMMDEMISSYLNVQDRGIMMGDVLKAYGPDNIYAISEIPADYVTPIVYNKEVLMQIENATIYTGITPGRINQTPDGLLVSYGARSPYTGDTAHVDAASCIVPDNLLLNFHFNGQPTAADVLVATRLTSAGTTVTRTGDMFSIEPKVCGTEIVTQCRIVHKSSNSVATSTEFGTDLVLMHNSANELWNQKGMPSQVKSMLLGSQFDWAPLRLAFTHIGVDSLNVETTTVGPIPTTKGSDKVIADYVFGDIDNSISITLQELEKLHNTAIYSSLGMPML